MNQMKHQTVVKLCVCAMMTAIVFVGNYLRVTMPVPLGGVTSFTLANILCALSGILLGPWWGALAAGLGSAFFDLTYPAYVAEAPITFFTKGMYGLVAGLVLYLIFKNSREKYTSQLFATICAALAYMVVYSVKVFFYNGMFVQGLATPSLCWALVVSKLPATLVNGCLAMIFAPILGVALMKALRSAHMERLLA
jgi:uncharacterized membrane protein